MKTLILFEIDEGGTFFFELVGDYSDLDGICINLYGVDRDLEKRLSEIVYDNEGNIIVTKLKEPTKDWDIFIRCGFLL